MRRSGQDSLDAAADLSYVRDSVAIPYLRRLVDAGVAERAAIDGLGRIGDPQAVQVLTELTRYPDTDVATRAADALERLRAGR